MRKFALLAFAGMLVGCGTSDINARKEWGEALSNYGVVPLYPMREDVYVGDVLLFVPSPCTGDSVPKQSQSIFLGSIPQSWLQAEFDRFYADRPKFPTTTPPKKETPAGAKSPERNQISISMTSSGANSVTASSSPAASGSSSGAKASGSMDSPQSDSIFVRPKGVKAAFTRLPMAAIPSISLYSYAGAALGGSVPTGSTGSIAAAFGGDTSTKLEIKATSVEVAQLPGPVAVQLVKRFLATQEARQLFDPVSLTTLYHSLNEQLAGSSDCRPKASLESPYVVFVNSIYYTRSIEFSFGRNSTFAARLAATLGGGSSTFNPPSLPDAPGESASAQASAVAMLKALGTMSGGPGVGGSLALGTEGNLALLQTYERPMGFGVQSYLMCSLNELYRFYGGSLDKLGNTICASLLRSLSTSALVSNGESNLCYVGTDTLVAAQSSACDQCETEINESSRQACKLENQCPLPTRRSGPGTLSVPGEKQDKGQSQPKSQTR